jgi:hypothetical protein
MKHFSKIISLALVSMPTIVLADTSVNCQGGGLCNPLGTTSLTGFLASVLKLVAQIGFPVIVLFIVYIGFLFIAAEGKPEKLKEARSYFFWAIVGGLIVLGAQALSYAIQGTVNQLQVGQ